MISGFKRQRTAKDGKRMHSCGHQNLLDSPRMKALGFEYLGVGRA
jgi:hypothetical protein